MTVEGEESTVAWREDPLPSLAADEAQEKDHHNQDAEAAGHIDAQRVDQWLDGLHPQTPSPGEPIIDLGEDVAGR